MLPVLGVCVCVDRLLSPALAAVLLLLCSSAEQCNLFGDLCYYLGFCNIVYYLLPIKKRKTPRKECRPRNLSDAGCMVQWRIPCPPLQVLVFKLTGVGGIRLAGEQLKGGDHGANLAKG